jgi:hypothetical protein
MEIEKILPFVLIPVFVGLIVVIAVVVRRAEQKRREALREVAGQLGMDFEPEADTLLSPDLAGFHLFKQGHGRRVRNLLRSRKGRDEVWLFDYRYVIGSGKNRSTHNQSVAAFPLGAGSLPEFELRPENVLHKIGAAFGYQDIDFRDEPGFSARYLVRGREEDAVRELFDSRTIEAVQTARNICVEGGGSWLLIYRARRRVEPANAADFLEEARALRAAFTARLKSRRC